MTESKRVLAVCTSVSEYRSAGYRTGLWLSELTHFWDELTEAGHQVDIVSVAGGTIPLDPESLSAPMMALGGTKDRYADRGFMNKLDQTRSVTEVRVEDYDAIYLTGGHGTMYDFVEDARLAELVAQFWQAGKVVSAVCHGPCGLLNVSVGGQPLLAGRTVTGYSMAEEKLAQRAEVVPFSLQDELDERAGKYTKALVPMTSHVEVDGQLVTGQNPMSAKGVAKAVMKLLESGAETGTRVQDQS